MTAALNVLASSLFTSDLTVRGNKTRAGDSQVYLLTDLDEI
jgi:hypothetical protein